MNNEPWRIEIVTPDGDALHPQATMVELATTDG
jgi:F0F1-type ATP synthase epsilon subunit